MELPTDRPLNDDELFIALCEAVLVNKENPSLQLGILPFLGSLGHGQGQPNHQRFYDLNKSTLEPRLVELCWRLVVSGHLVYRGAGSASLWGVVYPTERGKQYLAQQDTTLVIPGKLAERLTKQCPGLDNVTRQYADLAQDCFAAGHYSAAVILIGVASEATVEHLFEAVEHAMSALSLSTKPVPKRRSPADTLDWLDEFFKQQTKVLRGQLTGPGDVIMQLNEVQRVLKNVGDFLRISRNAAGHPLGVSVTYDHARDCLGVFPQYAHCIFTVADALHAL